MSAEYIMAGGNENVILCERGIRTFETATRNTLDISAVPVLHKLTHLPVVVDPSHGTGVNELVHPMALAAVAAGADGLIIEVHNDPVHALCDGKQSLTPEQFARAGERHPLHAFPLRPRSSTGHERRGRRPGPDRRLSRQEHSSAIRATPCYGLDIDPDVVTRAMMCGAIDDPLDEDRLRECGVVLVALYPQKCVDWLSENADRIAPDALVVDCCRRQARRVRAPSTPSARRHGWTYIGGHPMAGREFSGFGYAIDTLFARASMILTPPKDIDIARARGSSRRSFWPSAFAACASPRPRSTTA